MPERSTRMAVYDRILGRICEETGGDLDAVVDTGKLDGSLGIAPQELRRAVDELCMDGFLEYAYAPPRVRFTLLGWHRCQRA